VVALVAGESNINRRRTSPSRRHPRLMRKRITPLLRVCRTNLLILGAARAESAEHDPGDATIFACAPCTESAMYGGACARARVRLFGVADFLRSRHVAENSLHHMTTGVPTLQSLSVLQKVASARTEVAHGLARAAIATAITGRTVQQLMELKRAAREVQSVALFDTQG